MGDRWASHIQVFPAAFTCRSRTQKIFGQITCGGWFNYYGPLGVHNWVIWNEPEIEQASTGTNSTDSLEDYVPPVTGCLSCGAKEHDPEAIIHLGRLFLLARSRFSGELLEALVAAPGCGGQQLLF